jgi:flagellar assembly protein FliH
MKPVWSETAPLAPLAQKLPQGRPAAPAPAWMGGAAPAAQPLFPAPEPAAVDPAEVERQIEAARADARAEGERQGWAAAQADIAAALARLGEALDQVGAAARAMSRPYASELVELALIVARELVGAEVRRDPGPLVRLVERCLEDVAGESSITVRMHPADRAALLAARPDLARADLRLVEDARLARGGCAVDSTRRLVDARIEERLDQVRDGLRELLEEAAAGESAGEGAGDAAHA